MKPHEYAMLILGGIVQVWAFGWPGALAYITGLMIGHICLAAPEFREMQGMAIKSQELAEDALKMLAAVMEAPKEGETK